MNSRSLVMTDNPWKYRTWSGKNQTRNADNHYVCMTNQELLDLKPLIEGAFGSESIMGMWCTPSNMPFAIELLEHWGYKFATIGFTWVKLNEKFMNNLNDISRTNINLPMTSDDAIMALEKMFFMSLGHWTRSNCEHVIIGKKGKLPIQRVRRNIRQVVFSPIDEHSKKPDEINKRFELMLKRPGDTCYELFARRQYNDWHCTGLELDGLDIRDSLTEIANATKREIENTTPRVESSNQRFEQLAL
jgi:N6-adenosine-specific RNA methylase IME4